MTNVDQWKWRRIRTFAVSGRTWASAGLASGSVSAGPGSGAGAAGSDASVSPFIIKSFSTAASGSTEQSTTAVRPLLRHLPGDTSWETPPRRHLPGDTSQETPPKRHLQGGKSKETPPRRHSQGDTSKETPGGHLLGDNYKETPPRRRLQGHFRSHTLVISLSPATDNSTIVWTGPFWLLTFAAVGAPALLGLLVGLVFFMLMFALSNHKRGKQDGSEGNKTEVRETRRKWGKQDGSEGNKTEVRETRRKWGKRWEWSSGGSREGGGFLSSFYLVQRS